MNYKRFLLEQKIKNIINTNWNAEEDSYYRELYTALSNDLDIQVENINAYEFKQKTNTAYYYFIEKLSEIIEYYSKVKTYSAIFEALALKNNRDKMLKYASKELHFELDYLSIYFKALNTLKKEYSQELKNEKALAKMQARKHKSKMLNWLYVPTFVTICDKWTNQKIR